MARTTPDHDIARDREAARRRRVVRLLVAVLVVEGWMIVRGVLREPVLPALPQVDSMIVVPIVFFAALLLIIVGTQVGSARSPHLVYRPEQVDVRLDEVIGIDPIVEDVRRSLDLFWAHRTFADRTGGRPRRGLLFEGPPGTGKTLTAKAMAAEAGVPFLFVSATSFQSMYYGATARKIRSYFKALRTAAAKEGGAIGFIEEIDAIAMSRGFMPVSRAETSSRTERAVSEGTGGVLNELLVQMQSFDEPLGTDKLLNRVYAAVNLLLPATRQIPMRRPARAPLLLIAATNRADALDPALLRPGRFDRRLAFPSPDVHGRRALVDHFLARRTHEAELDDPAVRDRVAAATNGWTPVMIEHVLDEALVNAMRRGADAMSFTDVEKARITEMVGLGQPVTYTRAEQELIATHEAGHAVVAHLVAPQRVLEVVTIVKRGSALGLLAHDDAEDVYTRSSAELRALIEISMGGWCAEELFFGDTSTGPSSDLAAATRVAAQMVGAAGMTGSLVCLAATGKDIVDAVVNDAAARERLEGILTEARDTVRVLLAENRHLVEALRDALLERHELVGPEITEVLHGAARLPVSS
ncbi:MAG: AAA family ATPase [Micrococcales bacterium]|nr:AAA family ATPase [Micrococcales bacterium]MCL2666207.1 AAA family ATPase [Micrococcales bacterium]